MRPVIVKNSLVTGTIPSGPCGIKKTLYLDKVYDYGDPVSPYDVLRRDELDKRAKSK